MTACESDRIDLTAVISFLSGVEGAYSRIEPYRGRIYRCTRLWLYFAICASAHLPGFTNARICARDAREFKIALKREDARYTGYLACYEKVICKPTTEIVLLSINRFSTLFLFLWLYYRVQKCPKI